MTLSTYPFKGVPSPFKHQVETTQFIIDTPKCFVFNDIGTGKTWSAVWAIDYLRQIGEVKRVLIIAPLSTLDHVWKRTFFHLDSMLDVEVLKGTAAKRKALLAREANLSGCVISVINPDGVHIIADDTAIADYDMVLVDESAMFRNSTSRRVKALNKLCKNIPRVVMMTGSPCPEAPTDIWATARIVCPDRVPKYFGQFRDLVMRKVTQFKWAALPDAQEVIALLLNGFHIRYTREECIDLPPVHHVTLNVDATKQQEGLIKEIRKHAVAGVEDGTINAANEAVVVSKILQVASGAVKYITEDGEPSVMHVDCTPKLDALAEIIEASTQPVIVYAPYKAAIALLNTWLTDKSIPHATVSGDTNSQSRLAAFDAVQSGLIKVLVAHPQAMAHGITLTTSNIVVWWCPIYSHEITEQANGRITRPGQIRSQYVATLAATWLERRVLQKLDSKSQLQGTLMEYLQRSEH